MGNDVDGESAEPKVGRPTVYDPEVMPKQAEKLCELGATDGEVADFFEVSARTLYRWKAEHEEFCQSLKTGKEMADNRVERSLYQNATGFHYVEQQAVIVKTGQYETAVEVVDVERYQPAIPTAQIFWMKNRRSSDWRDKVDVKHGLGDDIAELLDARRGRASGETQRD